MPNELNNRRKQAIEYTHYFYTPKELNKEKWLEFTEEVKKLRFSLPKFTDTAGACYENEPLKLSGRDGEGEPHITNKTIWFNGEGENAHESFVLERKPQRAEHEQPDAKGLFFDCCKTARKPYDLLVCLVLISLKNHFGDKVEVSSDGDVDDWKPAVQHYEKVTGKKSTVEV